METLASWNVLSVSTSMQLPLSEFMTQNIPISCQAPSLMAPSLLVYNRRGGGWIEKRKVPRVAPLFPSPLCTVAPDPVPPMYRAPSTPRCLVYFSVRPEWLRRFLPPSLTPDSVKNLTPSLTPADRDRWSKQHQPSCDLCHHDTHTHTHRLSWTRSHTREHTF